MLSNPLRDLHHWFGSEFKISTTVYSFDLVSLWMIYELSIGSFDLPPYCLGRPKTHPTISFSNLLCANSLHKDTIIRIKCFISWARLSRGWISFWEMARSLHGVTLDTCIWEESKQWFPNWTKKMAWMNGWMNSHRKGKPIGETI